MGAVRCSREQAKRCRGCSILLPWLGPHYHIEAQQQANRAAIRREVVTGERKRTTGRKRGSTPPHPSPTFSFTLLPLFPILKHPRQVRIILAHLIKRSTTVPVTTEKDTVASLGEGEGRIGGCDGGGVISFALRLG